MRAFSVFSNISKKAAQEAVAVKKKAFSPLSLPIFFIVFMEIQYFAMPCFVSQIARDAHVAKIYCDFMHLSLFSKQKSVIKSPFVFVIHKKGKSLGRAEVILGMNMKRKSCFKGHAIDRKNQSF